MRLFRLLGSVAALCFASLAHASGMTLHIWMAEKAANEYVTNLELRELLAENEASYKNGAIFPDSGYVLKHAYGEYAHWHKFLNNYFAVFREVCPNLSSASCRSTFAHLLGSLSHSISDVNFDRYFVSEEARQDHGGDIDKAQSFTDPGCDFLAILDHKRGFRIPEAPLPEDILITALTRDGELDVRVAQLYRALAIQKLAIGGEALGSPFTYLFYKQKLSWGARNYLEARGGVEDSARIIATAWEIVWQAYLSGAPEQDLFYSEGAWPNIDFSIGGNKVVP